jgi:hypothetical protein
MSTITLTGFVHTRVDEFTGKREYTFAAWDEWKSCGYVLVGPASLEYQLPPNFNPIAAEVAQLKAEKEAATAAFRKRLQEINEQLAKLEAITYEPGVAA